MLRRDPEARLLLCGVVTVGGGLALALVGLLHPVALAATSRLPGGAGAAVDLRAVLSGLLLYVGLGAALITIGVGAIRRRRWAPPLLRIASWTWLITGLFVLALVPALLEAVLAVIAADGGALPAPVVWLAHLLLMGAGAVVGVALPALLLRACGGPDIDRACAAAGGSTPWTEACPFPVLTASVGLWVAAALTPVFALRPVVPLFGVLLTGWPALCLTLAGGVALAWAAHATYRQRAWGWWGATLLLAVTGASLLVTLLVVEPHELYCALGACGGGGDVAETLPLPSTTVLAVLTAALTTLSVGYMIRARRHFTGGTAGSGAD